MHKDSGISRSRTMLNGERDTISSNIFSLSLTALCTVYHVPGVYHPPPCNLQVQPIQCKSGVSATALALGTLWRVSTVVEETGGPMAACCASMYVSEETIQLWWGEPLCPWTANRGVASHARADRIDAVTGRGGEAHGRRRGASAGPPRGDASASRSVTPNQRKPPDPPH